MPPGVFGVSGAAGLGEYAQLKGLSPGAYCGMPH